MLILPTKHNIDAAREIRDKLLTWRRVYALLIREFEQYKSNIELHDVAYKVELVDKLYNCNLMMDKGIVAKEIINFNLDEKFLHEEPESLVNEISKIHLSEYHKPVGLVFASKFCHFHQPRRFPIYDKFARIGLSNLFGKKPNDYLNKYIQFKTDLDELIKKLSWRSTYQELDEYLWLYGQWISYKNGKIKKFSHEIKDIIELRKNLFSKLDP